MKKSAHQIWKESKEHNLSKEEFKEKLIENNVIVPKIKFRSFYNNKSMLYSASYINLYHFFELQPEKFPLMQFTNLKDKKGNDIYEGDILKTPSGIGFMVFDNNGYAIKSHGSEAVDYEFSAFYLESEIIGNIYENYNLIQ
jgi:uncharacterized phage protein (TIGR01671 family)